MGRPDPDANMARRGHRPRSPVRGYGVNVCDLAAFLAQTGNVPLETTEQSVVYRLRAH